MEEENSNLPQEDRPDIRPHLSSQESSSSAGSKGSGHSKEQLRDAEANPSGVSDGGAAMAAYAAGGGLSSATSIGRTARAAKFVWGSRKRKQTTVAVGGAAGAAAGIGTFIFLALTPLKVMSMMQNLEDHFFASSEQATGDMTEKLMQHYIVQKVMPGMVKNKCNSTRVSRSCALVSDTKTPVGQLYEAWRDAKLENKLFENQGIEIIKDGGGNFYMRTNSINEKIALGKWDGGTADFDGKVYARMGGRHDVRLALREGMKNETLWPRTMHYWGSGRLMEKKYGIRRCIMACTTRDKLDESVSKMTANAKRKFMSNVRLERILGPQGDMYSLALQCAMASFDCAGGDKIDPSDGSHSNQFDRDLNAKLTELRGTYNEADLDKFNNELAGDVTKVQEKGVFAYLLEKFTNEAISKLTTKAIPIVGWISLGASIEEGVKNAPGAIHAISNSMYAATAVSTYATYRTSADEMRDGSIDAAASGSVADSLSASSSPSVGQGGVAAEQTELYQNINHTSNSSNSIASLVSPSAYAAADDGSPNQKELCDDGSKLPSGSVVCPVLKFGSAGLLTGVTNAISTYNKSPMGSVAGAASGVWKGAENLVFGLIGKAIPDEAGEAANKAVIFAIKSWPTGAGLLKFGEDFGPTIIKSVMGYILPSIMGEGTPSGGRTYEVAAAGADIAGNDYAHYRLGGKRLSDAQASSIVATQDSEFKQEFDHKSMFARMFDTNSTQSLVSKIALMTPTQATTMTNTTVSTIFSNPMQAMLSGFSSMFTTERASAAPAADPFQVPQYGHDKADLDSIGDPDTYWTNHCTDMSQVNQDWGNSAKKDDATGQYINDTSNNCQWLQYSIMAAGGKYDTGLIPDYNQTDDLSVGGGSNVRIATFNVHGASHTKTYKARGDRSIHVVTSHDIDVVGFQELATVQRNYFMGKLGSTYDIYPKGGNVDHGVENSIIWKSSRFKLVKGGYMPGLKYFHGAHLNAPWIILQDVVTGQQFYVMNTHDPANTARSGPSAFLRYQDTLQHKSFIQEKKNDGLPIYFTGDFNSGYCSGCSGPNHAYQNKDSNTTRCILVSSGLVNDAYDLFKKRGFKCHDPKPSPDGKAGTDAGGVDHVFTTKEITVSNWSKELPGVNGSDHPTQIFDTTIPGSGGTQLTLGTYNLLDTQAHNAEGRQLAGCPKSQSNAACLAVRTNREADILTGGAGNPALDVFGTQETSAPQYNLLKGDLKDYAVFPNGTSGLSNGGDGKLAIWWNTKKFTQFDSGKAKGLSNVGQTINNPWVGLQDKNGNKIYVMSVHYANSAFKGSYAEHVKSAKLTLNWVKSKASATTPVFVVGDFNEHFASDNGPSQTIGPAAYCTLTNNGVMQNAFDMARKAPSQNNCPTAHTPGPNGWGSAGKDQIYITPQGKVTASAWSQPGYDGAYAKASDHTPVYVTVSLGGDGKDPTTGSAKMENDYGFACFQHQGKTFGVACDRQCVDFVKYRLKKHIDPNKFGHLGNGWEVTSTLEKMGYRKDHTPAVFAVASWPRGGVSGKGGAASGSAGHTAMVSAVKPNGDIIVEEYNYSVQTPFGGGYDKRTVPASTAKKLTYAHTEPDYR